MFRKGLDSRFGQVIAIGIEKGGALSIIDPDSDPDPDSDVLAETKIKPSGNQMS
jgi:hypothetical protein